MKLEERIEVLAKLRSYLIDSDSEEYMALLMLAKGQNAWFDESEVKHALFGLSSFLTIENLTEFTSNYVISESAQRVGVVMAGNIPAVGFHDLLCIMLCGYGADIKLSSDDSVIILQIIEWLKEVNPGLVADFNIVERLELSNIDKVIATGSDNTARYFKQYFGKKKHIIRQSRSSVAVISGDETSEDFKALALDVFRYYGLGCRNVTQIYVPEGYSFQSMLDTFMPFEYVLNNNKYANNYTYNRSVALINKEEHLDTGYLLVKTNPQIASPIGTIHITHYDKYENIPMLIAENQDSIQCVVSKNGEYAGSFPFGKAQSPAIDDYADGVDTMEFLTSK